MHDLVIKNALLLDGTGAEPTVGSLAVRDGVIAGVAGRGADIGPAQCSINADGLALMPGIVDGHTHYDAQLTWDPLARPSPELGVTTVVIGNCGYTIAPCRAEQRETVMQNFVRVEGMSYDALKAGMNWNFETFPEYLDAIAARGVVPNVASFIGHTAVRGYVMGAEASQRTATDAEVARMQALVREAMQAGAVGFSTATVEQHNGGDGRPVPSRLADDRELRALVGAMSESGRGTFMIVRSNQHTPLSYIESIVAETGRPALISAFRHHRSHPERVFGMVAELAAATSRGHRMVGAAGCLPGTMDFSLRVAYPFEGFPEWKPAMLAKDDAALRRLFADAAFRARMKEDFIKYRGQRMFTCDWKDLTLSEAGSEEHRAQEGRTVEELARQEGKHPFDWLLDFSLSENLDSVFLAVFSNDDPDGVGRLIKDPNVLVSLSDGGAHLSFLCDAGFGLHLLGHWVRELGKLTLQEAAFKLTADQAGILGIGGRGRLAPGLAADLLLFDPATVGASKRYRVRDLPGGASRVTVAASGLHGVWVNGRLVADATGVVAEAGLPGRVLRRFD